TPRGKQQTTEQKAAKAEYMRQYRPKANAARNERYRHFTPEQKAARAATNKRYREANAERLKKFEQQRLRDPKRIAAKKHYMRKHHYGLPREEYAALLERSGGVCEICGRLPRGTKAIHVDHDHATGHVRGLLCFICNRALGQLGGGDRLGLERALAYLSRAEQAAVGVAEREEGVVQLRAGADRAVEPIRHHAAGC